VGLVQLAFGDCEIDSERRLLTRAGRPVAVTPKAFELLLLLIERRPNAVSKREIYDRLWPDVIVDPGGLDALISRLRAALGDDARAPRYVRTVYGFGYAFDAAEGAIEESELRLVMSDGSRTVSLHAGPNLIGRGGEVALSVDSARVSRQHARIDAGAEGVTIEDLGSKNGTFVNGRRITARTMLNDGDEISIGPARMTFRRTSLRASTTTLA
jgi:DNA-binding winged helix-turn-helix (wHTH) protein